MSQRKAKKQPKAAKPAPIAPVPAPSPAEPALKRKLRARAAQRSGHLGIRVSDDELRAFAARVEEAGFTSSGFLRAIVLAVTARGARVVLDGAQGSTAAHAASALAAPAPVAPVVHHAPAPQADAFAALVAAIGETLRSELARDRKLRAPAPATHSTPAAPAAPRRRKADEEPEEDPMARRRRLLEEENEAAKAAPAPAPAPEPAPEKQLTIADAVKPAADPNEPPEDKTFIVEKAGRACEVCGEALPKGSKAAWPRAKGVTGMVHVKCWAQSAALRRSDARDA